MPLVVNPTPGLNALPLMASSLFQAFWSNLAQRRLSGAQASAELISFDDRSRFVFFGDLHRGDNGRADAFAPNRALFVHALEHYWQKGYSYIEVGDGDELWKNRRFGDIRRAHGVVFDLLHRFHEAARLHLIVGNHDSCQATRRDGLPVTEALTLRQRFTGQEILVLHGHQADFKNDRLQAPLRLFVQHIWRHLQNRGLANTLPDASALHEAGRLVRQAVRWTRANQYAIEQKLIGWAQHMGQAIVCGHTHRPHFARAGEPPYFNTGSCIQPGYITGLEIAHGQIALVRWRVQEALRGSVAYVREALSTPRSLASMA